MDIVCIDEKGGYVYFMASPESGTQKYLYRISIDGKEATAKTFPASSRECIPMMYRPTLNMLFMDFPNYFTPSTSEMITLQDHQPVDGASKIESNVAKADKKQIQTRVLQSENC